MYIRKLRHTSLIILTQQFILFQRAIYTTNSANTNIIITRLTAWSQLAYLDCTITCDATNAASDTTRRPIWPTSHHTIHGRRWRRRSQRVGRCLISVYGLVKGLASKGNSHLRTRIEMTSPSRSRVLIFDEMLSLTTLQVLPHSSAVRKLFRLPRHPPYAKDTHINFRGLKAHLWK